MGNEPQYTLATPTDVGEGDSKKTFWTNVGVGWLTKSGEAIDIRLNALPVNGRIILKKYLPKDQRQPKKQQAGGLL